MQNLIFKKLIKYLKNNPNGKAKLAYFLGYKSSGAIDQWLRRGAISKKSMNNLKSLLGE